MSIVMSTPDPSDHAARARVFLDNIHDRMRGGDGPELRTPEQKDLMATEALSHAVLALNETLNRIFPAEPIAEEQHDEENSGMNAENLRPTRQHVGGLDLTAESNPCPPDVFPDHWDQIVSAAITARAIGSVGARSIIPTKSGSTFAYEVTFRKTVSDDQWKISRTTPVGDVYFLGARVDEDTER